ncbi:hypothetical protein [Tatumella sp. UBA2305]|nr:hypothetical protein [Tatumella sp. UBA2305]
MPESLRSVTTSLHFLHVDSKAGKTLSATAPYYRVTIPVNLG